MKNLLNNNDYMKLYVRTLKDNNLYTYNNIIDLLSLERYEEWKKENKNKSDKVKTNSLYYNIQIPNILVTYRTDAYLYHNITSMYQITIAKYIIPKIIKAVNNYYKKEYITHKTKKELNTIINNTIKEYIIKQNYNIKNNRISETISLIHKLIKNHFNITTTKLMKICNNTTSKTIRKLNKN